MIIRKSFFDEFFTADDKFWTSKKKKTSFRPVLAVRCDHSQPLSSDSVPTRPALLSTQTLKYPGSSESQPAVVLHDSLWNVAKSSQALIGRLSSPRPAAGWWGDLLRYQSRMPSQAGQHRRDFPATRELIHTSRCPILERLEALKQNSAF